MPTYEYYCEANGQTVDVIHLMSRELETWGEVCELAEIEVGETPRDSPVIRQLSAISSLIPKSGNAPRGASRVAGGETHPAGAGTAGRGRCTPAPSR